MKGGKKEKDFSLSLSLSLSLRFFWRQTAPLSSLLPSLFLFIIPRQRKASTVLSHCCLMMAHGRQRGASAAVGRTETSILAAKRINA